MADGHLRQSCGLAIMAPPMPSAARSTISSAMRRSPASRSSRATGTASGPAMRRRIFRRGKFEPVGLSFVGGSLVSPGAMEALRAQVHEGQSAPAAVPRRPARRGEAGLDVQHAAEARRPLVPRICEERSTSNRARALSNPDLAPHLEFVDLGRARLCDGPADRRRDAHRVRLHPASDHAQRKTGRRAAALSGRAHCEAVGSGERPRLEQQCSKATSAFDLTFSRAASAGSSSPASGPCSRSCAP